MKRGLKSLIFSKSNYESGILKDSYLIHRVPTFVVIVEDKFLFNRRIHHVKFLAFYGNQLEYNGSQGANGAG